jgi:hypothetical protein
MGMFYLKNPAMMKGSVFPKELASTLCVDYTCKGCECIAENCAFAHPRQPKDIEKLDIEKIASFFKQNKHGYLSEYHFRRLDLSETAKSVMGGAEGITSSKMD